MLCDYHIGLVPKHFYDSPKEKISIHYAVHFHSYLLAPDIHQFAFCLYEFICSLFHVNGIIDYVAFLSGFFHLY